jgi:hypothetical protein
MSIGKTEHPALITGSFNSNILHTTTKIRKRPVKQKESRHPELNIY